MIIFVFLVDERYQMGVPNVNMVCSPKDEFKCWKNNYKRIWLLTWLKVCLTVCLEILCIQTEYFSQNLSSHTMIPKVQTSFILMLFVNIISAIS